MPGKYGSSSVTIAFDDAPGGVARTITSGVLEMSGMKITSGTQDSTAYGDTAKKILPTGVLDIAAITIRGFWDTTATTGSHAVFKDPDDGPQDATRTLTVVVGDSKTWTCEGYLISYEVLAKAGSLTEFVGVYQPISAAWS